MSSFDDFSHRNDFPAGVALMTQLAMSAAEGELFWDMPALEFVSRFRRHWDRGLKFTAVSLKIRHAIETYNRDLGKGNRYRRRLCAIRVLADFKAERLHS